MPKTLPLALLLSLLIILSCCSGDTIIPAQSLPADTTVSGDALSTQSGADGMETVPDDAPPAILMPDPVSVVSEEAENSPVFGSEFTRGEIAMITFLPDPSKAPDSAWDVSEAQDGSVMAWTLKTRPPFDLYIAAQYAVTAPENCSGMFCGYSNLERVRFQIPFDTSRAANMSAMFDSCAKLADLDVSAFDTSAVTDMESMFRHCGALRTLDVSGFDTSHVTDMRSMFRRCVALKALDVSGFDMSNVKDVRWMFADCSGLERLDRNAFDFSSVELHDDYMKNVPIRFSATPLSGTYGFDEARNYTALFDGDIHTKWCLMFQDRAYVEWKMPSPGSVAHLSLTSADNHDEYPGRNPGSWRLLGADAEKRRDGVWTVIGKMDSSGFAERDGENYVTHTTTFSGEAPEFQYYRLEITSTTGAKILQMSEIDMDYR
ncbi:MAG: BspA family leucine-rich repeat surface protein [Oscillospiraceae bacterium]|nr:BspA family leucine-rich repeat surface protein [Oscillospiraceae bacterium]